MYSHTVIMQTARGGHNHNAQHPQKNIKIKENQFKI